MEKITLQRLSLKDQVVDVLRERILCGELAPGTRLVERDLAALLDVSRVPIRDALLFLEAEGLVVSDQRGRSVIALTPQLLADLYPVRAALEEMAVELCARHCQPADIQQLRRHLDAMREAVAAGDPLEISQSDVALHRALWLFSGNAQLTRVMQTLVGPIFMFAAVHARAFAWEDALQLHADLIDCIERGDADAARESMRRHLGSFKQRAEQILT